VYLCEAITDDNDGTDAGQLVQQHPALALQRGLMRGVWVTGTSRRGKTYN